MFKLTQRGATLLHFLFHVQRNSYACRPQHPKQATLSFTSKRKPRLTKEKRGLLASGTDDILEGQDVLRFVTDLLQVRDASKLDHGGWSTHQGQSDIGRGRQVLHAHVVRNEALRRKGHITPNETRGRE